MISYPAVPDESLHLPRPLTMRIGRLRIFLYTGVASIGLCALAYLGHPVILRAAGDYLVVEDTLEPASAIVVLNSQFPYRAFEGAKLYEDGWAPKVIVTRSFRKPLSDTFESLGIHVLAWHERNLQVLLRSGVPPEAIEVMNQRVENTLTELRTVIQTLSPPNGSTLIIVTSHFHTRRTAKIWNYLTKG